MIPSAVVRLDALPLTPNGKLDRAALPMPEDAANGREPVAPRTATEQELAAIWCEVLKLERVGIEDNFFELGGHSLLAIRMIAAVRERLQVELPLRAVFTEPTVATLSQRIEPERRAGAGLLMPPLVAQPIASPSSKSHGGAAIVPLQRGSSSPLFLIHPIGGGLSCYSELVPLLGPDQTVYGVSASQRRMSLTDLSLHKMADE